MINIRDSFLCTLGAGVQNAFTPVYEEDKSKIKDYSLVMTGDSDTEIERKVSPFNLLKGCHMTSEMDCLDPNPGVLILDVLDETGSYEPEGETTHLGVYVRNNLPMWVKEIAIDIMRVLGTIDGIHGNTISATVQSKQEFDAWLSDDPQMFAFCNDVLMSVLDPVKIKEFTKMISTSWETEDDTMCLFGIKEISKESITITPIGSLIRILPFEYKASIKDFSKEVLEGRMVLYAVTN